MLEGADPGHAAALCVLHDAHETRIGDVPAVGRAYITTAKPEVITGHQTAGMPDDMAKMFQALTAEYEATKTLEARLAHDADKLETLLQAIEYGQQGYEDRGMAARPRSSRAPHGLRQAAGPGDQRRRPGRWWTSFAASYHELRASSRGRSQ